MITIQSRALTPAAFAPFGDVMQAAGTPDKMINHGMAAKYADRARMDFSDGRPSISISRAEPRSLPYRVAMMERHPLGSQAFIPMSRHPFLVIVAEDDNGRPGEPRAFITAPSQCINFLRGTWHGVLTPLHAPGLFAVIDRVGDGDNLQEHWYDTPYTVL